MFQSFKNPGVRQRLGWSFLFMGGLATCFILIANALRDNLVFFFSPTELQDRQQELPKTIRVGGLVAKGSVQFLPQQEVRLLVTDHQTTIPVVYRGLLPDLFQAGQGVVAQGQYTNGIFHAQEILAKHDETYMPPEVARALQKNHGQHSLVTGEEHAQ